MNDNTSQGECKPQFSACQNRIPRMVQTRAGTELCWLPCERWRCAQCRAVHVREWRDTFHYHIDAAPEGTRFYATDYQTAENEKMTARHRRMSKKSGCECSGYFAVETKLGRVTMLSTSNVGGSKPMDKEQAKALLDRIMDDPPRTNQPISGSRKWKKVYVSESGPVVPEVNARPRSREQEREIGKLPRAMTPFRAKMFLQARGIRWKDVCGDTRDPFHWTGLRFHVDDPDALYREMKAFDWKSLPNAPPAGLAAG